MPLHFPVLPVIGGHRFPFRCGGSMVPQLGPATGPHMVYRSPSLGYAAAACWGGRLAPARLARLGAEEGLSSSQDSLLTVQHPLRRRVLGHPLQVSGCFPWPSPHFHRLGSLLPVSRRLSDDASPGFAAAADRSVARPLAGTLSLRFGMQDLSPCREPCYRGPWPLPGPDLHWLVVLSLSLGSCYSPPPFGSWRPSHLDALILVITSLRVSRTGCAETRVDSVGHEVLQADVPFAAARCRRSPNSRMSHRARPEATGSSPEC